MRQYFVKPHFFLSFDTFRCSTQLNCQKSIDSHRWLHKPNKKSHNQCIGIEPEPGTASIRSILTPSQVGIYSMYNCLYRLVIVMLLVLQINLTLLHVPDIWTLECIFGNRYITTAIRRARASGESVILVCITPELRALPNNAGMVFAGCIQVCV